MIDALTLADAAQAASETAGANALAYRAFAGNAEAWIAVAKAVTRTLAAHGYTIERFNPDEPEPEVQDDVV